MEYTSVQRRKIKTTKEQSNEYSSERAAWCWSKTRIRAISLPDLRFLFCLAPSFSGTKPNGKSFPTKCRTSGDCSSMPRRNRVVKKLFVWWPWMQHSHNASMNRDKNHACPNIVSKHARHARDSCSPDFTTSQKSKWNPQFFRLTFVNQIEPCAFQRQYTS